jgi:hypothetical protein
MVREKNANWREKRIFGGSLTYGPDGHRGHTAADHAAGRSRSMVMEVAVGRCPQTGAPLASQSTISRLESEQDRGGAAVCGSA